MNERKVVKLLASGVIIIMLMTPLLMMRGCWPDLFWAHWLVGVAVTCGALALLVILWKLADETQE